MRKYFLSVLIFFALLVPVFAGGQGEDTSNSDAPVSSVEDTAFQVTDSLGRTVEFEKLPSRIFQAGKVAFILTNTVYLFPDEAKERFMGTSRANQGFGFFAEALDSGFQEKVVYEHSVSTEEIVALQPDLVVIKDFLANSMEKSFDNFGIKTIFMNLETPEAFYDEIITLGTVLGNPERAENLSSWYREKMNDMEEKLKAAEGREKPEILLLYYNMKDGVTTFSVPPMNYIQTDMVNFAGGVPVWRNMELGQRWTKVGLEQIAAWDPDYVFIVSYFNPASKVVEDITADPVWQTLDAVRNSNVYAFPRDYHSWDQPGPGWILGYRWLAGVLNPDLISSEAADVEEYAREYYKYAYKMGDELFDTMILPRIRGEKD